MAGGAGANDTPGHAGRLPGDGRDSGTVLPTPVPAALRRPPRTPGKAPLMAKQPQTNRPATSGRPRATPTQVKAAIGAIKRYHAVGRKSLREVPERGAYDKETILNEARRLGRRHPGG